MSKSQKTCATCGRVYQGEADFLKDTSQWRMCNLGNLWFNCNCGSTLMLKKGKFDWYSPDKFMSPTAASFFNEIAAVKDLPHMPSAVISLQTMLQNPETEVSDLAATVKKDPFIAAEILTVANGIKNLRNPRTPKIDSIEHAITYMGRKALSDIVLAVSIKGFQLETKTFDTDAFWEESFLRAAVCEFLVKELKLKYVVDEAYLAGCLANIGKIISALCYPDETDKIYEKVQNPKTQTNWNIAEKDHEFTNHTTLGEVGGALWGLPEYVITAARFHHRKPKSNDLRSGMFMPELVGLANNITHWLRGEPALIEEPLLEALKEGFGLSTKELEAIVEKLLPLRDQVAKPAA